MQCLTENVCYTSSGNWYDVLLSFEERSKLMLYQQYLLFLEDDPRDPGNIGTGEDDE